jgi:hypothetical protein
MRCTPLYSLSRVLRKSTRRERERARDKYISSMSDTDSDLPELSSGDEREGESSSPEPPQQLSPEELAELVSRGRHGLRGG